MKEMLTFNDVLILPNFSTVGSRKDVNLSYNGEGFPYLELPIISANMDSVTTDTMAKAMLINGAQACLHRFQSIEDNVKMLTNSKVGGNENYNLPLVSIGLGKFELERAEALVSAGAYGLVVDVAHGASMGVVNQVKELRKLLGHDISITVGNFAESNSLKEFLEYLGPFALIQGVKVGVGPGAICKTRIVTGVGVPQLSAIMDISRTLKDMPITVIADGGMSTSGDVAKALAAGAHMVMSGSLFAGTDETPGEKLWRFGNESVSLSNTEYCQLFMAGHLKEHIPFKKYRGSASKESYEVQGKTAQHRAPEGESIEVPYKGPVKDILQQLEGGLRSSFSYVGARNLKEFQEKARFISVSNNTVLENGIRK